MAMPNKKQTQPVDLSTVRNVLVSALCDAMYYNESGHPFGDEIKTCAQELVDYMLSEDEDVPLIKSDGNVKVAVKMGLSRTIALFEDSMKLLPSSSYSTTEATTLQYLSDVDWVCDMCPKLGLMEDFILRWGEVSKRVLIIIGDNNLGSVFWDLKLKLIIIAGKVLDAVGYGTVIFPADYRVNLLKMWLPYLRKMKPLLDAKGYPYAMNEELCESIEGAIVSLVLALPSNDQADILADWMSRERIGTYPDLSNAFEIWCYRAKSAKRRLLEGPETLSDSSQSTS